MRQILFVFFLLGFSSLDGRLPFASLAQSSSKVPRGLVAAWNFDETKGDQKETNAA
jgi:hypothetical protein